MSKAIAAAPPSTASVVPAGHQRTRQSRKVPDCRAATINIATQRQSKNGDHKKSLRSSIINTIITSLPAAASTLRLPQPFSSRLSRNKRRTVEADLGPVRYLAAVVGQADEVVLRWFILIMALLLDPAAVLLLLAATRTRS